MMTPLLQLKLRGCDLADDSVLGSEAGEPRVLALWQPVAHLYLEEGLRLGVRPRPQRLGLKTSEAARDAKAWRCQSAHLT